MKSLKSICEASLTHSLLEVSILGDIDDQIEAADKSIKDNIEKWIKENYDCDGPLKISDKPNKDGLYEVNACSADVKNKSITSLTNGMFEWKVAIDFYCNDCTLLTSLEGAPKEVRAEFDCSYCNSLKSLEGAPKEVTDDFYCHKCKNLSSLEGAPKKVGGGFYCSYCDSLKTLKGAPKKVGGDFYCRGCKNLSSLNGTPKEVGRNFDCSECKTTFSSNDIKKISNVKGKISC